jgi:hypothetical protein
VRREDDFDRIAEMAVESASVQSALRNANDGDLIIALASFMRSHCLIRERKAKASKEKSK